MTEARGDSTRRILLVEDLPGDADLILELLVPPVGHPSPTTWVTSLAAARTVLLAGDADVVLLDLGLPDGSGVACVHDIHQCAGAVPIVVLTGSEDPNLALSCLDAGAQDYVGKRGLERESLRRAIDYAMARTRESMERYRANALQVRLAAIVEASSDAIVSISPQGRIESWNRGAETIFQRPREEVIGRHFNDVVRPPKHLEGSEQHAERLAAALGGGQNGHAREVVRLRNDGSEVILSVITSLLRDEQGQILGLAGISRDITELKRRDDELKQRNAELLARDRQMRALAARLNAVREEERTRVSREVHDELGQLLTGLKMDLRWIDRRIKPGAAIDAELIAARLAEAASLTDTIMAAVQRIALELRPSALDTLGLAAAIRDEARRYESRTGLAVEVELEAAPPPPAEIATALFRIFQELLTNVVRHAQATSVRIRLEHDALGWQLRVSDDGVGLSAEATSKPTSLGLLGMRERADSLGGSISIVSNVGSGTVTTVSVPHFPAADHA
jgi:two-component system sensor histidine kinase UhpB